MRHVVKESSRSNYGDPKKTRIVDLHEESLKIVSYHIGFVILKTNRPNLIVDA